MATRTSDGKFSSSVKEDIITLDQALTEVEGNLEELDLRVSDVAEMADLKIEHIEDTMDAELKHQYAVNSMIAGYILDAKRKSRWIVIWSVLAICLSLLSVWYSISTALQFDAAIDRIDQSLSWHANRIMELRTDISTLLYEDSSESE